MTLLFALLASATLAIAVPQHHQQKRQTVAFTVPFYDASANGFTGPARGWNSFGIQANKPTWSTIGFDFNQYHMQQHCDNLQVTNDYTYCSIDSGWSVGGNGDDNGRIIPDTSLFNDLPGLASHLHDRNIKLGVYVLPGGFEADKDKKVEGMDVTIGSLFNTTVDPSGQTSNSANLRVNWDYTKDGVQQWHDSVIKQFASWGIDLIKLDYVTPGSPGNSGPLPYDSSGSVIAYHKAIQNCNCDMRLDISWKLVRDEPYFDIWKNNADSLRLDTDINNSGSSQYVAWQTVQRAIEQYRIFITQQTLDSTRQGKPIMVRPDMDSTFIGNSQDLSGITDQQRYSMAIHWIGTGANLMTGSAMTNLDGLGKELLFNQEAMQIADFTSQWPMQPRNPDGWGTVGGSAAMQLQAWVSGPNKDGTAVVVLANYGPDLCLDSSNNCSPTFGLDWGGVHTVSISLEDLGIGGKTYSVRRIWGGGGAGGGDHVDIGNISDKLQSDLGEGESVLYKLTVVG